MFTCGCVHFARSRSCEHGGCVHFARSRSFEHGGCVHFARSRSFEHGKRGVGYALCN